MTDGNFRENDLDSLGHGENQKIGIMTSLCFDAVFWSKNSKDIKLGKSQSGHHDITAINGFRERR